MAFENWSVSEMSIRLYQMKLSHWLKWVQIIDHRACQDSDLKNGCSGGIWKEEMESMGMDDFEWFYCQDGQIIWALAEEHCGRSFIIVFSMGQTNEWMNGPTVDTLGEAKAHGLHCAHHGLHCVGSAQRIVWHWLIKDAVHFSNALLEKQL